MGINESCL